MGAFIDFNLNSNLVYEVLLTPGLYECTGTSTKDAQLRI